MTSGRKLTARQIDAIHALSEKKHPNGQWLWSGEQIAEQLSISLRTIRRYIRRRGGCVCRRVGEHKLRNVWHGMLHRCRDQVSRGWHNYKGRGVAVCDEWKVFEPFKEWAIGHGYSPGLEIDRIDNSGDYCPGNCRFVSRLLNSNNKRNNIRITAFGETKTATQWSRDARCIVTSEGLINRIRQCPDAPELALTTPPYRWNSRIYEKVSC